MTLAARMCPASWFRLTCPHSHNAIYLGRNPWSGRTVGAGDGNRTRMTSLEDPVNVLRTARDVGFCWSVDPQAIRSDRDGCYMDCYRPGRMTRMGRDLTDACPVIGLSVRSWVIARGATRCYSGRMSYPEITQRDLRSRSREIMDAVEHGQSFTVTRDGHRIGELIPLRRRRRFVLREEFAAMSRNAPDVDLDAFRADQEAALDQEPTSPYER
jgi:antitoxin (DNA-binding transcriptional repressor) of toxin-antitoxin stability system